MDSESKEVKTEAEQIVTEIIPETAEIEVPNDAQAKTQDKEVIPKQVENSPSTSRFGRVLTKLTSPIQRTPKAKIPSVIKNGDDSILNETSSVLEDNSELDATSNTSNIVNDSSSTSDMTLMEDKVEFEPGQLAWAHVGNYPYWPCLVTREPGNNTFVSSKGSNRGTPIVSIHVHYFGDNGRRAWVTKSRMMIFEGRDKFLKEAERINTTPKKQAGKNLASLKMKYNVQKSQKVRWDIAVDEAEKLLPIPQELRTDHFFEELEARLAPKNLLILGKRKNISDDEDSELKKSKQDLNDSNSSEMDANNGALKTHKRKRKSDQDSEERSGSSSSKSSDSESRSVLKKTKRNSLDTSSNSSKSLNGSRKSGKAKSNDSSSEDELQIIKSKPQNPFKGIKQERVCQICEKPGDLIRCKGPCYSFFHLPCVRPDESSPDNSIVEEEEEEIVENGGILEDVKLIKEKLLETEENEFSENKTDGKEDEESFKCIDCLSGVAPACFVCNGREGDRVKCNASTCGKHYHNPCLKLWPQSHWQGNRLTCPYHVCHTCTSDHPQNCRPSNERLVKCVRCPSAYHPSISCLPAGSTILTGSQIVCPKHYQANHRPVNATWCFVCTHGGSLICCDTCPTSFHAACLKIKVPEGDYICEDCETGKLPLHGEVVWAKLGQHRWWPSYVCYPHEIPEDEMNKPHSPGEFCIMLFGHGAYHWVHRGRVFSYQDDDANMKVSNGRKAANKMYEKAMAMAYKIHLQFKQRREASKGSKEFKSVSLKPPYYVKLKMNKPVGNVKPVEMDDSIVACQCSAKMDKPCALEVNCMNRMLMFECSPDVCPAGTKCNNQDFVQRCYPNMEPFHTNGRGWGLKSMEPIRNGQFVIEYVGEIIDEAEYKLRLQQKKETKNENYYFLTIDTNRMIDAEPKGNLSRFMNHSCQPNCETQKWTVNGDTRIGLFALRDIEVGEELTFNYHLQSDGEWRKACLCGAPNCTGYIGGKSGKPQVKGTQSEKMEKSEKAKQSEKTQNANMKKIFRRKLSIEDCWVCGKSVPGFEDSIRCGLKTCPKIYHKSCVVVDEDTKFNCLWHFCKECNRRTSMHCSLCIAAFCPTHVEGNLEENSKGRYLCKNHEVSETLNGKEDTDVDSDLDKTSEESESAVEELSSSGESGASKRKSRAKKKIGSNGNQPRILEGDFEAFYTANRKFMESKNASEEEARRFLLKLWRSLDNAKRQQYKRTEMMDGYYSAESDVFDNDSSDNSWVAPKRTNELDIENPLNVFARVDEPGDICHVCQEPRQGEQFECQNCSLGCVPKCRVCEKDDEESRVKCSVSACAKTYHPSCLQTWPQSNWRDEELTCPSHVCHTCFAVTKNASSKDLARCIRCPKAYHFSVHCIPVGSKVISESKIICPKHQESNHIQDKHDWCMLCEQDEVDVSCTGCSVSFHSNCLGLEKAPEYYTCEDCALGRLPIYGEVVWLITDVEQRTFWPSLICFPQKIPSKTMSMPHKADFFCVKYLGMNKYIWTNREKVFIYHGPHENFKFSSTEHTIPESREKALITANELFTIYTSFRQSQFQDSVPEKDETEDTRS